MDSRVRGNDGHWPPVDSPELAQVGFPDAAGSRRPLPDGGRLADSGYWVVKPNIIPYPAPSGVIHPVPIIPACAPIIPPVTH